MKKIWSTKKSDKIFSLLIRNRDPMCFFKCGRHSRQASHFWGREKSNTRYDTENVDGVCGHCHLIHEANKQGLYRELKVKQLGAHGYIQLQRKAFMLTPRKDVIIRLMKTQHAKI